MGTTRWHRFHRAAAAYLASAPGTHILLLIIAVTTLVLRGVDAPTTTRILRHQSTNLLQMSRDAPRVLVLSAFLLDNGRLLVEVAMFTLVLAPVERWVGTYRWLATFTAGHVGATLATTVGIWLQVREGAGRGLVYPVDVGVSYGLMAAAGVLTYRLRRPWILAWLAFLAVDVGRPVITTGTFTDWGHLVAVGIGLAIGPLVRPDGRRRRDRRHMLVVVGAGLLAGAAGCLVFMFTEPDQLIVLPRETPLRPGHHVLVVSDPGRPEQLRPLRPPQRVRRVSPDSLFGVMAAAGGAAGAGMLVLAGRKPT